MWSHGRLTASRKCESEGRVLRPEGERMARGFLKIWDRRSCSSLSRFSVALERIRSSAPERAGHDAKSSITAHHTRKQHASRHCAGMEGAHSLECDAVARAVARAVVVAMAMVVAVVVAMVVAVARAHILASRVRHYHLGRPHQRGRGGEPRQYPPPRRHSQTRRGRWHPGKAWERRGGGVRGA